MESATASMYPPSSSLKPTILNAALSLRGILIKPSIRLLVEPPSVDEKLKLAPASNSPSGLLVIILKFPACADAPKSVP